MLAILVTFAICLAACSSNSHPATKLLGKWQESASSHRHFVPGKYQFFRDGSVATGHGAGTYKFIDPTHVKIDLGWAYGTNIYEVVWLDKDHVTLRAVNETLELERLN